MGIPRFFRTLSERYPLLNENVIPDAIPEFDNLYLDMNGIVHTTSHNNTGGLCVTDEREVFSATFNYVTRLFQIIKPKKLLYMAIDGCAPRAKMNQQRSRRFRAANDAREGLERAREMGEAPAGEPFDSNCITPGTEFMTALTVHLNYLIQRQITEDPLWEGVEIVLSGPDTPGEGEHKILDYIRKCKAQPDYDPNTRHCLYGLDADLIMLSLATHEPHFALFREEVVFGKKAEAEQKKKMMSNPDSQQRFQLLHISLLREYLDIEFSEYCSASVAFSVEHVVDDFILFCTLVGNDFLPHLPLAEISEGGLLDLLRTYKEHLKQSTSSNPWLTHKCGTINFEQFALFLTRYSGLEEERLNAALHEEAFTIGKQRTVGPGHTDAPTRCVHAQYESGLEGSQEARDAWYDAKFGLNTRTASGLQQQHKIFQAYVEGLQWVMSYYFRGTDGASWSWYYPHYHAPFAMDLCLWSVLRNPKIELDIGQPFLPFQQLMAVLPAASKALLPKCYQWLFDSEGSPIVDFYPGNFEIDMDGVKVPWGGVTLIPFIEPSRMLEAMAKADARGPPLTDVEQQRNRFGLPRSYKFSRNANEFVKSPWPMKLPDLARSSVKVEDFHHKSLPAGVEHFPCEVPAGCTRPCPGFPTLRQSFPISHSFDRGVRVFGSFSREKSLFIHAHVTPQPLPMEYIGRMLTAQSCFVDYPHARRGRVVAVFTPEMEYRADGRQTATTMQEHKFWVWDVVDNLRKKGIAVEGGDSKDQHLFSMVEVQLLEGYDTDARGRKVPRFSNAPEYRLVPFVRVPGFPQPDVARPKSQSSRGAKMSETAAAAKSVARPKPAPAAGAKKAAPPVAKAKPAPPNIQILQSPAQQAAAAAAAAAAAGQSETNGRSKQNKAPPQELMMQLLKGGSNGTRGGDRGAAGSSAAAVPSSTATAGKRHSENGSGEPKVDWPKVFHQFFKLPHQSGP